MSQNGVNANGANGAIGNDSNGNDFRDVLQPCGDGIWTATRPMRFFLLETGTRMTVVRLSCGGLFVHSPVALDARMREAIDSLGPVRAIVAPSRFHHLFVPQWIAAYPDARSFACPGLSDKRPDVAWNHVLGDEPDALWRADLAQVFFGARPLENEVVFFHAPSRSMICVDAVFNLSTHPSWLTRAVAWVIGNRKPGATFLEPLLIRDRAGARAQIERMLAWDFDRILLAHGQPVTSDGRKVLQRAFEWL
ncbi:DUF4336 domain-containing protein [Pendulispora albinea]|uniref:DUF4336 domain-containing protein n=1 Tax=Pendulispora albinea TaxID=2741071 RepID=A0ABZ2LZ46_9BACT